MTGYAPPADKGAPVRRLVRVAADVEPAHHDRLAALSVRHGVSLGAVVAAAIQAGLPAVERRPTPLIILGELWRQRQGEWRDSTAPPPGVAEIDEKFRKLWEKKRPRRAVKVELVTRTTADETPPSKAAELRRAAADTGTLIRKARAALAERGAAAAEAAPVRRRLVRVAADVEPAHHARLVALQARVAADVESARHTLLVAALSVRHGVSLGAVVAAAIQAGLPAVERRPAPGGPGGARGALHPADTHDADR